MERLHIRKIGKENIKLHIQCRMTYCLRDSKDVAQKEYEAFFKDVEEWTLEQLKSDSYYTYAGYLGDELICFAGVLIYELPPILNKSHRKKGHVLSMFTYPQHRQKGYGAELFQYMIDDSKKSGIEQLVLNATPMGEPLYYKMGFKEPVFKYMALDI